MNTHRTFWHTWFAEFLVGQGDNFSFSLLKKAQTVLIRGVHGPVQFGLDKKSNRTGIFNFWKFWPGPNWFGLVFLLWKPSGTLIVLDGSPSWTLIRWYGSKNGLHISKKSKFLIVGIANQAHLSIKAQPLLLFLYQLQAQTIVKESKRDRERETFKWGGICEQRGV